MEIQERIEKFLQWCEGELTRERKQLAMHREYLANREYIEKSRIKPLIATANLIEDLCRRANIMISVHVEEQFKRIKKFGGK